MRKLILSMVLILIMVFLAGCMSENTAEPSQSPDAVSTASLNVSDVKVFEKSIGKDGKWIICTVKDLETESHLVLEGDFVNNRKDEAGNDVIQRKIALYEQDDKRNVTARYTLKAPSLTIKSPNAKIQGGTFIGDLYVETNDFQLVDTKIEGNIYFKDEEAKAGFVVDEASSVTGKQDIGIKK